MPTRNPQARPFARSAAAGLLAVSLLLSAGCERPLLRDQPVDLNPASLPTPVRVPYEALIAPGASLGQRNAAAEDLIGLVGRQQTALEALAAGLSASRAVPVNQAVLQAVATWPGPPPRDLWRPMLLRLGDLDAAVFPDLAVATGRYEEPLMLDRLLGMAFNPNTSQPARSRAILALGHQRTQAMAGRLLELTSNQHPAEVRSAAFDALATLTGIRRYGEDRAAWERWWSNARSLGEAEWERQLRENFVQADTVTAVDTSQVVDRLLGYALALYRTASAEDRPKVLAYQLEEALQPLREQGVSLAEQRLTAGEPFGEPLREALRNRLDDPLPDLRRRAALLLRDLGDDPAAQRAAEKLNAGTEGVTDVVKAYLQLLARMPRGLAVESAFAYLLDPALRPEAAGVLAAAAERGMLDEGQRVRISRRVREIVRELPDGPPPQVVTLLGRLGGDDDFARIARWVNHPDPSVKQAAAQAWADSTRSLLLLAQRAGDPIIQPIVITAAQRRGSDPAALAALAEQPPAAGNAQARDAWGRALVAMAGRVPASRLLPVIDALPDEPANRELREAMLTAGLESAGTELAPAQRQLLLRRADLRLADGRARLAALDYDALADQIDQLEPQDRQRVYRGQVRAALATDQLPKAFGVARTLLRGPDGGVLQPATDDPIIELFIATARGHVAAGRRAPARRLLDELRLLLGPTMKPEVAQEVRSIEQSLEAADPAPRPTPTNPAASPAPTTGS